MDLSLAGKSAIVGGATSGLGLAVAQALAGEGVNVVMVGRRAEALHAEAERIGAYPIVADMSRHDDLVRVVELTMERNSRLDILVWNTGGPPNGPATSIGPHDVRAAFDVLLAPLVDLVNLALPHLRAGDAGRIRTKRLADYYADGAPSEFETEIPMGRFGRPAESSGGGRNSDVLGDR